MFVIPTCERYSKNAAFWAPFIGLLCVVRRHGAVSGGRANGAVVIRGFPEFLNVKVDDAFGSFIGGVVMALPRYRLSLVDLSTWVRVTALRGSSIGIVEFGGTLRRCLTVDGPRSVVP